MRPLSHSCAHLPRLAIEAMERRDLLASDWQNGALMRDVDNSDLVTATDAVIVVNLLNESGSGPLGSRPEGSTEPYCDVTGDGELSPLDLLLIINALNKYFPHTPEISASLTTSSDPNQNGVVLQDQVTISGQALGDVTIHAKLQDDADAPLETVADADGNYQVTLDVPLGSHVVELTAIDDLGRRETFPLLVRHGDLAQDWNRAVLDVVRTWTTTSNDPFPNRIVTSLPPMVARNMAMISSAMFDAANAVSQEFEGYLYQGPLQPDASAPAAAAAAAYHVAKSLYSSTSEMAKWEATLAESLRLIPEGPAKTAGLNLGQQVANLMLSARAADGVTSPSSYQPTDAPGHWDRTAPDFLPPVLPHWKDVDPFVLADGNAVRPAAPPALDSAEYAAAVNQVMALGSLENSTRTEDQSQIAQFWADGSGTITPPGHWNQIASDIAFAKAKSAQPNTLIENARAFALLNLALADAGIASWDAKYSYDFWRPIDAIRQADADGNPATSPQTNWTPLLKTPPFPSYTSGHSTFSGAAAQVLESIYGTSFAFSVTQDTQLGPAQRAYPENSVLVRQFANFDAAAQEAGMSRIYGGIHYSFDNTAGLASGRAVGQQVAAILQPV